MKLYRSSGFTLIELILVVAIIALLAAIMMPVIAAARLRARVAKTVQLADTLKHACIMYNSDTGSYAREDAGSPGPANRGLTIDYGISGWDGPYIEKELTYTNKDAGIGYMGPGPSHTPLGGIRNQLWGYDLDGDGSLDKPVNSDGNELILEWAWENEAKALNDCLDKDIPGDWRVTGRVRFALLGGGWPAGLGTISVYLIGGS
ncbi:MAG: prepilin-type N-terminal cleavage/methylation domain-containing protein [Candidatus Omnitrophica bacterium]|nr:prepilin-type N-terminal cleavage/methylation domain-containing protein [Candidatus Omnitrophota bacterium]